MAGEAESPANSVSDTPPGAAAVPAATPPFSTGRAAWLALGAALLLIGFVRLRLLHLPLERDEGEFAYGGQLLLRGIPPFVHLYAMKLPGIYAAYALLMALFGQSLTGIRIGLLVTHLVSTVLLFVLARRLLGGLAAAVAATAWAVAAMSPESLGMAGHATHFVVAFGLGGLLLLPPRLATRPGRYFLAGLLLGLAFAMKQSGAAFAAFGGVLVLWQARAYRGGSGESTSLPWRPVLPRLAAYTAGVLLPVALLYVYLYASGVWELAYFWNFIYAKEYAALTPPGTGAAYLGEEWARWSLPYRLIWLAALLGLTAAFWSADARPARGFVWGLFAFGALAVVPGLYFRPHYFLQALPGAALACGLLAVGLAERLRARSRRGAGAAVTAGLLGALPAVALLAAHRAYFFTAAPNDACRVTYFQNPFPESLPIAEYLRKNTAPGERVAVFGSEPQVFFYSGRDSATGHVYMYPLMEPQRYARAMQEQMIQQVEAARPRYLVLVSNNASWLAGPWSDGRLREWIAAYRRDFAPVAVADQVRHPDGTYETRYVWDAEARGYRPRSEFFVAVLRRRDSP